MAYARYGRNCEWYIFWYSTKEDAERGQGASARPKAEETVAVWHSDHRANGPLFTYAEVSDMVGTSDFSRIPGYSAAHRALIAECLTAFIKEVDNARGAA